MLDSIPAPRIMLPSIGVRNKPTLTNYSIANYGQDKTLMARALDLSPNRGCHITAQVSLQNLTREIERQLIQHRYTI
jgi:hypothetical protein